MNSAEHDEFGVRVSSGLLGQLEGVARDVGESDHFVALIVMTENECSAAESGAGGVGTRHQVRVAGQGEVAGAGHPSLGIGIGVASEQQQRQRSSSGLSERLGHGQ